jgi:pimeloyl-ACP methyl ester carboxylesterase
MIDNSNLYRSAEGYAAMMAAYDATLEQWPVPYESMTIPTRHGDTHLIVSGAPDFPPLILLGGAGANATRWLPNVCDLSRTFRTYAIDAIGESGKSAPNRPSYRGDAYGEWLVDAFDALKVEKATRRATRLIPNIRVDVIPNAGHTVSDDQPAIVNSRIVEFLGGHER